MRLMLATGPIQFSDRVTKVLNLISFSRDDMSLDQQVTLITIENEAYPSENARALAIRSCKDECQVQRFLED